MPNTPGEVLGIVALRQVFLWHCPFCGMLCVADPIDAQLDAQQQEEAYRAFHQMEPWQELPEDWRFFRFVTMPATVRCDFCLAESCVLKPSS